MKLYHGTSDEVVFRALSLGLEPRGKRPGNWEAAESRADCVYLTQLYAGYYADAARGAQWGILEIDTDKLDPTRLLPDENALEQAFRYHERDEPPGSPAQQIADALLAMDVAGRTAWFRERLPMFGDQWHASVRALGNCAYRGTVPPKAVTRAALYDPKSSRVTALCLDPKLDLMSVALARPRHEALTAWLMGGPLALEPFTTPAAEDAELVALAAQAQLGVRRLLRGTPA